MGLPPSGLAVEDTPCEICKRKAVNPPTSSARLHHLWHTLDMAEEPILHIGSDFDDFLREENLLEVSEATAAKRVIAFQIAQEMKRCRLTKSEMASRMKTSRPAVERLLDPANPSVTLSTLERAASAVGRKLKVELA